MKQRNKIFNVVLFTFFLLTAYSLQLNATIRYVSKTGLSIPPFTSWETAADSIQKCINICVFGDTIYVANGVYEEQVVMIPGLALIGAGMDSCMIDIRDLVSTVNYTAVYVAENGLFTGFNILVYYNSSMGYGIRNVGSGSCMITMNKITTGGIGTYIGSNPIIYKNIYENVSEGIWLYNSDALVRNNSIYTDPNSSAVIVAGIRIDAFTNEYTPTIDSNYIEIDHPAAYGILKNLGSSPTIMNNFIKSGNSDFYSIGLGIGGISKIFNNLIITEEGYDGIYKSGSIVQVSQNYVTGPFINYGILVGPNDTLENNVVTEATNGIGALDSQGLIAKYNNSWNNGINYGSFTPDTTNLSVDPMIVNEDTTQGELDFHLQKYSPLIDAGDPNILDRDGSRSDIGLYGGPYGWTYTYQDLAPRPPHNVTATIEEGLVKLTWNKNTEADFNHYRIYRDTLSIVIYDSSKIRGETVDTFYYDNLPPVNHEIRFYYVITAFDNQGNQSYPSEEISVLVTGMTEHPPIGYDGYRLLANYPNPFNPSTVIPYRLKEAGYVKLYVYDIKGELVRVLVNQWQEKGYYEVLFYPNTSERSRANSFEIPMGKRYSNIATGVYIYMIQVYNDRNIPVFSDSEKMILLK